MSSGPENLARISVLERKRRSPRDYASRTGRMLLRLLEASGPLPPIVNLPAVLGPYHALNISASSDRVLLNLSPDNIDPLPWLVVEKQSVQSLTFIFQKDADSDRWQILWESDDDQFGVIDPRSKDEQTTTLRQTANYIRKLFHQII